MEQWVVDASPCRDLLDRLTGYASDGRVRGLLDTLLASGRRRSVTGHVHVFSLLSQNVARHSVSRRLNINVTAISHNTETVRDRSIDTLLTARERHT